MTYYHCEKALCERCKRYFNTKECILLNMKRLINHAG